jgi:hypothetical protein
MIICCNASRNVAYLFVGAVCMFMSSVVWFSLLHALARVCRQFT